MRMLFSVLGVLLFASVTQAGQVGDMDGDGLVGLKEAIISLQVVSGQVNPISSSSFANLTECSGNWVDTMNNPQYCGDCDTVCDSKSLCNQGECISLGATRPGEACDVDADCFSGICEDDVCEYVEPTSSKVIFITSTTYSGNLGGLNGADEICNQHAAAAQLAGNYKAWLSDSEESAADRLTHSDVPYVDTLGNVIALNWTELITTDHLTYMYYDEFGSADNTLVWTGTNADGDLYNTALTCSNWLEGSSGSAMTGNPSHFDDKWTEYGSVNCSGEQTIYCIQQ